MTTFPRAVHLLIAVLSLTKAETEQANQASRSVVLIKGVGKQDATGVIVGWEQEDIYFLTVSHAFRDEATNQEADTIDVMMDVSVCDLPSPIPAHRASRLYIEKDFALAAARIPAACRDKVSRLHPLRRSPLNSLNGVGKRLLVIARSGKNLGPPHEVNVAEWNDDKISLSVANQPGMSGGLLLTPEGEIVGMVYKTISTTGYATDIMNVMNQSELKNIPFNLAGRSGELQLKSYPAGTHLVLNKHPKSVIELVLPTQWLQLRPGRTQLQLSADGYESIEGDVEIPDVGTISRCVHLVRPIDRWVAHSKWPLLIAGAGLAITTAIFIPVTDAAKRDFYAMPTREGLDDANRDVGLTRWFLAGAIALGGLSLTAFALDRFRLSPTLSSSMYACP